MSFFQCHFFSQVLKKNTTLNVILPDIINYKRKEKNKFKTIYLLHGLTDDYNGWNQNTSLERYAKENNMAIIMPDAEKSFYTNMLYGEDYFDFISQEVIEFARAHFPLSDKREDNYIVGNSMGGYGSFKVALSFPDKFCCGVSLSGVLDIVNVVDEYNKDNSIDLNEMNPRFDLIFGDIDQLKNSQNDLFYLLKHLVDNNIELPRLLHYCGTEDFLFNSSNRFIEYAKKIGVKIDVINDNGNHTWDYWDKYIRQSMDWMQNRD